MKKLEWMVWFLILTLGYAGLLFLVKYYILWPGIIVLGAVMAFRTVSRWGRQERALSKNQG